MIPCTQSGLTHQASPHTILFAPPHTVPPPPLGARAQLSAHDAAADLLRSSLAHRLGAQVDVDHQHRRVVLEPPKPGRRVLRSQRGQGGVSGAVGPSGWAVRAAPNMPRSPPSLPHPCHDPGAQASTAAPTREHVTEGGRRLGGHLGGWCIGGGGVYPLYIFCGST